MVKSFTVDCFGKGGLKILLEKSLSRRELEAISKLQEIEGLTFSASAKVLRKFMPESSAKAVLRKLCEKGLLKKENGFPLVVSEFGKKICEVLE